MNFHRVVRVTNLRTVFTFTASSLDALNGEPKCVAEQRRCDDGAEADAGLKGFAQSWAGGDVDGRRSRGGGCRRDETWRG